MRRITVDPVTRIEGHLRIDCQVDNGKITNAWSSGQMWRGIETILQGRDPRDAWIYTQRFCGVCTTVHAIVSVRAVENALNISPSEQTNIMRTLAMHGLMIRDHGLHLYVFSLPDVLGKDSILKFDENDEREHQLLHDTFDIKKAGNQLSIAFGGRSVHAPFMLTGGFTKYPRTDDITKTIDYLKLKRYLFI